MAEKPHPILGAGEALIGLSIMGNSAEGGIDGLGKLAAESVVDTGLSSHIQAANGVAEWLSSVDHSTLQFLDALPLAVRIPATLGIIAFMAAFGFVGYKILGDGVNEIKHWLGVRTRRSNTDLDNFL